MKVVLQRTTRAEVSVEGKCVGEIGLGLVVLLGVEQNDTEKDAEFLAQKIADMRIFADENNKMNKSLREVGGKVLLISQFTLMADWRKGRRPAFTKAAAPEVADKLYMYFAKCLGELSVPVETGVFAAHMEVSLVNDGPVTIILDNQLA